MDRGPIGQPEGAIRGPPWGKQVCTGPLSHIQLKSRVQRMDFKPECSVCVYVCVHMCTEKVPYQHNVTAGLESGWEDERVRQRGARPTEPRRSHERSAGEERTPDPDITHGSDCPPCPLRTPPHPHHRPAGMCLLKYKGQHWLTVEERNK